MSFDFLWQGMNVALLPQNLLIGLIGCFLGTIIGCLPAIGPINGIALLLPIAYTSGLAPESTLILLASIYYGAEYGGRISSILLNVPGDAGAVMTALDGYPMARKGEATKALAISGISSFIGGMLAVVAMTFLAVPLSWLAIKFGPAEYFVLMVFAFATLGSMVGHQPVKTLLGCVLGLMLTTIGLDATSGAYRFTFDQPELHDGIEFIILVIGLFSISEVLLMLESQVKGALKPLVVSGAYPSWSEIRFIWWPSVRATVVGFVIGVLPGTGASVASAVSYTTEKRISDKNGTFGHGDMRGLAAPEAANNAAATGAFVPMLTLGVPGSGTTAVMLGALMLYNIQPGPQLFVEQPKLVGGLIASMYIGNILLLIMNLPMVQLFARMLLLPNWVLIPGITALSILGVYSAFASVMSVVIMFGIGIVGYLLRKLGFDMAPIILGFVLGKVMEVNMRNALAISGGEFSIFFSSTLSLVLWVLAALVVCLPWWLRRRQARLAG
ncbi:MAG: tripartite tricarboxylate transporter permease [Proteobacteria bacterium]|nr:tripartite tricarboxylate transporter permease [Pseudomonadota bacterium]